MDRLWTFSWTFSRTLLRTISWTALWTALWTFLWTSKSSFAVPQGHLMCLLSPFLFDVHPVDCAECIPSCFLPHFFFLKTSTNHTNKSHFLFPSLPFVFSFYPFLIPSIFSSIPSFIPSFFIPKSPSCLRFHFFFFIFKQNSQKKDKKSHKKNKKQSQNKVKKKKIKKFKKRKKILYFETKYKDQRSKINVEIVCFIFQFVYFKFQISNQSNKQTNI